MSEHLTTTGGAPVAARTMPRPCRELATCGREVPRHVVQELQEKLACVISLPPKVQNLLAADGLFKSIPGNVSRRLIVIEDGV
jgi:hypothetical protein